MENTKEKCTVDDFAILIISINSQWKFNINCEILLQ